MFEKRKTDALQKNDRVTVSALQVKMERANDGARGQKLSQIDSLMCFSVKGYVTYQL